MYDKYEIFHKKVITISVNKEKKRFKISCKSYPARYPMPHKYWVFDAEDLSNKESARFIDLKISESETVTKIYRAMERKLDSISRFPSETS